MGELPDDVLPLVVDIPMETFAVWHSVRAIPWDNRMSHLEVVTPNFWHPILCDRYGELLVEVRGLSCQGLTFMTLDSFFLHG